MGGMCDIENVITMQSFVHVIEICSFHYSSFIFWHKKTRLYNKIFEKNTSLSVSASLVVS